MGPKEFFSGLTGVERVYGDPVEKDGVTVIPALSVWVAGGFGSGAERGGPAREGQGGGGTATARPAGAYVIKDGAVSWEPAVDVGRIVLGGQILAGLALILFVLHRGLARRRAR